MVLCSWLLRASAADGMGRKMLTELHGVSPIHFMYLGYSRCIHYFGHIYGKIEKYWKGKGS